MSKIENQTNAIAAVLAAGFVADGQTDIQKVRIATVENPVYGGIGGKIVATGGRDRFRHPSGARCTIGPITTNFYLVGKKLFRGFEYIGLGSTPTKNLDEIKQILATLDERVAKGKQDQRYVEKTNG